MPFPEFDPAKKKILFFSRGRGRGHAIPDIEIVKELHKLRDDVEVRFVSYATGARTLEELGYPLIDLGQPEISSHADVTVLAGRLIGWLKPDLVVSHEEFAALPAAKIFDKPTAFVTDWFIESDTYLMDTLKFADKVLFIDEPGIFEEPRCVQGRINYLGPILPEFADADRDRFSARRKLGIAPDATVISVLIYPGRRSEEVAPLFDLLMPAIDALDAPNKFLVWNTSGDYKTLVERLKHYPDKLVLNEDQRTSQVMAASDIAVTKGNRNIALELAALGIPSVAVSHGLNRIDDLRTSKLEGNVTLKRDGLTIEHFASCLQAAFSLGNKRKRQFARREGETAATQAAAQAIVKCLEPDSDDSIRR